jgi:hypothetical protein
MAVEAFPRERFLFLLRSSYHRTFTTGSMRQATRKSPRVFCTECGASLEEFWRQDGVGDVKAIIQRMARCKAEGRFHGHFCARLWIAGDESFQRPQKGRKAPARKVEALKKSIQEKIGAERKRHGGPRR